jgi:hypothetical protein
MGVAMLGVAAQAGCSGSSGAETVVRLPVALLPVAAMVDGRRATTGELSSAGVREDSNGMLQKMDAGAPCSSPGCAWRALREPPAGGVRSNPSWFEAIPGKSGKKMIQTHRAIWYDNLVRNREGV